MITIDIDKNTKEVWSKQSAAIEYESKSEENYRVNVNIEGSFAETLSEVVELRYFFPLEDLIRSRNKDADIHLHINLTSGTDDEMRVKAFLSARIALDRRLTPDSKHTYFYINGIEIVQSTIIPSRISPIFSVSNSNDQTNNSYYDLLGNYNRKNDKTRPVISDITEMDLMCQYSNQLYSRLLQTQNIAGTVEIAISSEQKEKLVKEISLQIEDKLCEMNILAQIIWLLILNILSKNKELFLFLDNHDVEISTEVISKTYFDSISYAEGIYQIIENACLYSDGEKAWFGFRIHQAGRNLSMGDLVKEVNTREYLHAQYKECILNKNIFNEDFRYYFEFYVLDRASENSGILHHYLSTKDNSFPTTDNLADLFSLPARNDTTEHILEDITTHYGLKLFKTIIVLNNGYLKIQSPLTAPLFLPTNKGGEIIDCAKEYCNTEISGLVPIRYSHTYKNPTILRQENDGLIYERVNANRQFLLSIEVSEDKVIPTRKRTKLERVFELGRLIREKVKEHETKDINNMIIIINANYKNSFWIEILAKAIFRFLAEIQVNENCATENEVKPRIAVVLNNETYIGEFVRIFAAFYLSLKESSPISNSQIALCMHASDNLSINFIIGGENIQTAFLTANQFMYFDPVNTIRFMPLLQYLTKYEQISIKAGTNSNVSEIFPFDLYMRTEGKKSQPLNDSCFLQKIHSEISNKINTSECGCLIDDISVRIGSKVYLDKFYEGELLFQRPSNITRFAYLLYVDIIDRLKFKEKTKVILLGYETYSTMLVMNLKNILDDMHKWEISAAVALDTLSEEGKINWLCETKLGGSVAPIEDNASPTQIITIIPIGTTLSTVYKIHNIVRRQLWYAEGKYNFDTNYSIFIVSDDVLMTREITKNYWEDVNIEDMTITIRPEIRTMSQNNALIDNDTKTRVKYLVKLNAKWLSTEDLSENHPVIQVDKTETVPDSIFQLMGSNSVFSKEINTSRNTDRIHGLLGCVSYSHIYRKDNHYQFYFAFSEYFLKRKDDISKWLQTARKQINRSAFNIVVSPLQETNSLFINEVIEQLFNKNLAFLHFPIMSSYRDDIRARFSYLSREYQLIKKQYPNCEVNLYYIDDSIVTGATIARSRILLRMLLGESGSDLSEIIFTKIILLINRSSPNTISEFVKDPNTDLFSYLYLLPPSYNTRGNSCPACKLVQKYQLLQKRSATLELSEEFRRLGNKHKMRKFSEHNNELNDQLKKSHTYYVLAMQWIIVNYDRKNNKINDSLYSGDHYLVETVKKIYDRTLSFVGNNNHKKETSLSNIFKETQLDEVVECVRKCIIQRRDYIRLETTHEAIRKFSDNPDIKKNINSIYAITTRKMLELIYDNVTKIDNAVTATVNEYRNYEYIISFIKILSREQISKYYYIRYAIYNIMRTLLIFLLKNDEEVSEYTETQIRRDKHWESLFASIRSVPGVYLNTYLEMFPALEYQLIMILVNRLADMECEYVFKADTIKKVLTRFHQINTKTSTPVSDNTNTLVETIHQDFPELSIARLRYLRSIKAASMFSGNDNLCLTLMKEFNALKDDSFFNVDEHKILLNSLYIENTKLIYDFTKKYILDNKTNDLEMLNYLKNSYDESGNILWQNPNKSFCQFWKESTGDSPQSEETALLLSRIADSYKTVYKLQSSDFDDTTAYLFEELCYQLCQITDNKMCYIISHVPDYLPQVITQSGYYSEYLDKQAILSREDLERILWLREVETDTNIIKTLIPSVHILEKYTNVAPNIDTEEKTSLIQIICIDHVSYEDNNKRFYIITQTIGKTYENTQVLRNAQLILTFRERLSKALNRHYARLINNRYDCSYIRKLSGDETISILHISDLHCSNKLSESIFGLIDEKIDKVCNRRIDLLAVSGDLVDARDSDAISFQKNYIIAGKILLQIVRKLWEDKKTKYIPLDWKRRVLVVPGNHDYSSMNQYRSTLKQRALASSSPIDSDAGIMAKFTYYIEFLLNFLDAPIDELLNNNLNEIRRYRNLKLKVLMINSAYKVSPLRSNKFGVHEESVRRITEREIWKNNTEEREVCITHYSPTYKADYFSDAYKFDPSDVCDSEKPIVEIYNSYRKIIAELSKAQNENLATDSVLSKALILKLAYSLKIILNKVKNRHNNPSEERYSQLVNDVTYFERHLNQRNVDYRILLADEKIQAIISLYQQSEIISELDSHNYREIFEDGNLSNSISVYLSGHEHKNKTDKINKAAIYKANALCKYPEQDINDFHIITINDAGATEEII